MPSIRTDVIPKQPLFTGTPDVLHFEALCVFAATGFFLDTDTYYKGQHVLKPGCQYQLSDSGNILKETPYFTWHYSPKERPFDTIVQEFGDLFEQIVFEGVKDKQAILPLSGGLDSRTQAVALKRLGIQTHAYSYAFEGGHDETRYGAQIAQACDFPFQSFTVPKGYLWNSIERLADLNGCYSEFTHPRQMAFIDQYGAMGDVFSLGHWGDVLFDYMGVPDDLNLEGQVSVILNKIIKKGGLYLAESLWQTWGLSGDFKTYLRERITDLMTHIDIPHSANARIRAFKSLYWAPRWTSVNLCVFEAIKPVHLPYYDDRMCAFICSVPERFLAGRQIQIAYIKQRMPELARIRWQAQRPFNLYNFNYNHFPYHLPYRVLNKVARTLRSQPYIQRNWELQFLGAANDKALRSYLFDNPAFQSFLPQTLVQDIYTRFQTADAVTYSHPLSLLLTLSLFSKTQKHHSSL